jgi:DNA-binding Lrp family transcriptional regulator
MDLLDKKIVRALQENCRVSYQELAKRFDVTLNAIKKRVSKLLGDGVISFCVEPSLAMIRAEWVVAFVRTSGEEKQDKIVSLLGDYPMINEVGPLADGEYFIFANYIGLEGLHDLTDFLKSLETVTEVEIHQVMFNKGKARELSKRDLRIIQCLVPDPRMRIVSIAEKTGYSAKTVRRVLDDLIQSDAIGFTIRFRPNAGDNVTFLIKLLWDDKKSSLNEILDWLTSEFSEDLWAPLISVTQPCIIGIFIVDHVREISPILERVKHAPFTLSAMSKMGRESYSFTDIRSIWLENQMNEASLS